MKKTQRFLAFVLILILAFALSVPASAAYDYAANAKVVHSDFTGKTIYLIASQGSSGYGRTVSEVESLCPGASVIPGTSIYCEDIPDARPVLYDLIKKWNSGQ